MRVWLKEMRDNRLVRDVTIDVTQEDTRTHKVFMALEQGCYELDIPVPQWLDRNIAEFQKIARTRFYQDAFVGEQIPFDYLDFHVIEEDEFPIAIPRIS